MGDCEQAVVAVRPAGAVVDGFVEGFPGMWEGLQLIGILTVDGNGARVPVYARCLEEARAAMTRAMAQIVQAMGDGR